MDCGFCGEHFIAKRSDAQYCSRRCKSNARQKRNRQAGKQHEPTPVDKRKQRTATCVDCGVTFIYEAGPGATRKRCPEHYAGPRHCALCGEMCQPALGKHHCRSCSNDLKELACDEPLERVLACGDCGESFVARRATLLYCSTTCTSRAYSKRNLDKVRANYLIKRARRIGASEIERILPSDIYERDGGICQLCDYPVNPTVEVPNPFAVTVDHKIPLSKGGAHTLENVQLAHFYCNSAKSDRVEFQLI